MNVTRGTKPKISTKTPSKNKNFGLRFIWKNWTLYFWRKVSCGIQEIQYWMRFMALPHCENDGIIFSWRFNFEVHLFFLPRKNWVSEENCHQKTQDNSIIYIYSWTFQQIHKLFFPFFGKRTKFPQFLEIFLRQNCLFRLRRKIDKFWGKEHSHQKPLNFVEKTQIIAIKKTESVNGHLKWKLVEKI